MPDTVVATANVLYTMPPADAARSLDIVLAHDPDLVALQEWYVVRAGLLRRTGDVRLVPGPRLPSRASGYHWSSAVACGNVVGARADRYEPVRSRAVLLTLPGRTDRTDRVVPLEPPRLATVGVYRDRATRRTVALVSYHLVPGAGDAGRYRDDRPRLVPRHRREVRRLEGLVAELHEAGHVVHAAGDSNFDALTLAGLTSAWAGRDRPGTCGRRTLDDVHGPGPATRLELVETPSDHRAVVVTRPD